MTKRSRENIIADILKILKDQGPMPIEKALKKARVHDAQTRYKYMELLECQHLIKFDPKPKTTWGFRPPDCHITRIGIKFLEIWAKIEELLDRSFPE